MKAANIKEHSAHEFDTKSSDQDLRRDPAVCHGRGPFRGGERASPGTGDGSYQNPTRPTTHSVEVSAVAVYVTQKPH